MKLIRSVRHSSANSLSEDRSGVQRRVIRISLLGTLRDVASVVQLSREERYELDELQRLLGTKSRRETIQIASEFHLMMEKGHDYDSLLIEYTIDRIDHIATHNSDLSARSYSMAVLPVFQYGSQIVARKIRKVCQSSPA